MDTRIMLTEKEIPQAWYNVLPDLPQPLPPPLHPGTGQPITPQDLAPLFPMELIKQEMSPERWIPIPQDVIDLYKIWRPSPLQRAHRLEKALKTKTRIYFKNESGSPAGSHKLNTAVAQAYYNKKEGVRRLTTETGAGQWGSALSIACKLIGLECTVYMVRISFEQKPYRKLLMQAFGGTVHASPSNLTNAGKSILAKDPNSPGSLGMAISEAVEDAATHDDAKYTLGSVLNHVMLHQTVIGLETKKQLELVGEDPSVVIGCVGGGSNFSGLAFPFVTDKLKGKNIRLIGVEPASCPTLTKGIYAYDYGDSVGLAPIVKMYTLGHTFVPPSIHAGGLRYHGDSPALSLLVKNKVIEAQAYKQKECFEAALLFAQTEGILPAPETSHAIKAAVDEARKNEDKCIVFGFSGHGFFDLTAYDKYLTNQLDDHELADEEIKRAIKDLPKVGV